MASFSGDFQCDDDYDYDYHRSSYATSKATSASAHPESASLSASASSDCTTPITSSQLCEGLGGKIQRYPGIAGIRRAVDALSKKLYAGETTDQYLVFRPVTVNECDEIDNRRDEVGKGIRLTHCADIGTLIIKIPTPEHEQVLSRFTARLLRAFDRMGVPELECAQVGATRFRGISSSKEADGGFKSGIFRPHRLDWPTLKCLRGRSLAVINESQSWCDVVVQQFWG